MLVYSMLKKYGSLLAVIMSHIKTKTNRNLNSNPNLNLNRNKMRCTFWRRPHKIFGVTDKRNGMPRTLSCHEPYTTIVSGFVVHRRWVKPLSQILPETYAKKYNSEFRLMYITATCCTTVWAQEKNQWRLRGSRHFPLSIYTPKITWDQQPTRNTIEVNLPVFRLNRDPIISRPPQFRNRRSRGSTWPTKSLSKFVVAVSLCLESGAATS